MNGFCPSVPLYMGPISVRTGQFLTTQAIHNQAMLTEAYIEALLVDEELADQVWKAWDTGEIDDVVAFWAWWIVVTA